MNKRIEELWKKLKKIVNPAIIIQLRRRRRMTDKEYFTYIGKNKLWVNWSNFIVQVGDANNWAYHSRPTHTTDKVTDENGKVVERSRKLEKDEVCPVPIYEPDEALRVACQKYIDRCGVEQ